MAKQMVWMDQRLLDGAAEGKSPNELSAQLNGTLSPAECAVRVRKILADRDVWTDPERRKLMLHKMHQIVNDLATLSQTSGDSKDYSTLVRAMDLLRKITAEQRAISEEEMAMLVRAQAAQMLEFITKAMERAEDILAEKHPTIPREDISEAIQAGLAEVTADETE